MCELAQGVKVLILFMLSLTEFFRRTCAQTPQAGGAVTAGEGPGGATGDHTTG